MLRVRYYCIPASVQRVPTLLHTLRVHNIPTRGIHIVRQLVGLW